MSVLSPPVSPPLNFSLASAQEYFATAFQGAPVLFAISTIADGCYIHVNEVFLSTLGFSREEVIGKTSLSLNLWTDPAERSRMVTILRNTGTIRNQEVVIRKKSGELFTALFSGSLFDFGDHSLLFTLASDVTDLRHSDSDLALLQNVKKDLRHSNERLALAAEIAELGTLDFYPRTGLLECDEITHLHFGLSPGAPVDYSLFLSAVHPEDRNRVGGFITELVATRKDGVVATEYRAIGIEDGTERWLAARGQMFYNSSGQAVRFIGVTRDITKKKQYENTILQLNRLHAVLSAINQMILHTHDAPTIYREVCRIAIEQGDFRLAVVGLQDETRCSVSIGAAYGDLECLAEISNCPAPGDLGPSGISIREGRLFLCNDIESDQQLAPWSAIAGRYGIRSCASIPLHRAGAVIGALSLYAGERDFFDVQQVELITQIGGDLSFALDAIDNERRRIEAEEALRMKRQVLIHQSRHAAMGEMIGNIAHQWRQPLNTLGLHLQAIPMFYRGDGKDREQIEGCVEKGMELIQHMSQTIDDFRNFFKLDKERKVFNAAEEVRKTMNLVRDSFLHNHIVIDFQVRREACSTGYPNEFCQALMNIVQNARDAFASSASLHKQLTIEVDERDGQVLITVGDTAGGIPEDILDRIFEPYFSTKGAQGTGIGLYMAKTIIETNMGGSLTARNVDAGAEFTITLPVGYVPRNA